MFENIEITVDLNGEICLVVSGSEGEPTSIVLECVSVDDAYAPRE